MEERSSSWEQYNTPPGDSLPDLFRGAMPDVLDVTAEIWLNR
jgi:hypothetical protein